MKFIVEKGSKKRIKKTMRLQRTWALKILVCPWRKISVMLHTLYSVHAIFFFSNIRELAYRKCSNLVMEN